MVESPNERNVNNNGPVNLSFAASLMIEKLDPLSVGISIVI